MKEVFGYGVAHRATGERLCQTGRKVYDSKSAASSALNRAKKLYDPNFPHDQNPDDFEVVSLVPCYE